MHLHILGICGTFMGGIAALAQSAGHRVTGSDANVYPPMSDFLARESIRVFDGYRESQITGDIELVVVGNAISRGNAGERKAMAWGRMTECASACTRLNVPPST